MITATATATLFYFSSFFCTDEVCSYSQFKTPVIAEQCAAMGEGFEEGIRSIEDQGLVIEQAGWKCVPAEDARQV